LPESTALSRCMDVCMYLTVLYLRQDTILFNDMIREVHDNPQYSNVFSAHPAGQEHRYMTEKIRIGQYHIISYLATTYHHYHYCVLAPCCIICCAVQCRTMRWNIYCSAVPPSMFMSPSLVLTFCMCAHVSFLLSL
jgi:hypothetical protein